MKIEKNIISSNMPSTIYIELRKNLKALGLYSYLCSLPNYLIIDKNQIKEQCNIGTQVLNSLLKFLKDNQLIKMMPTREYGRYSSYKYIIDKYKNF
jgi:hypothetical protein